MIDLDDIAEFLDRFLAVERFDEEERGGVYYSSPRPISRFGLALEPWQNLAQWAVSQKLDALFLHRPWKLQPRQLPKYLGIVSYHLAFDERLTLSFNPRLAEVLSLSSISVLGEKAGRPIGMIGDIPTQDFANYCDYVKEVFGGQNEARSGVKTKISRVAVVGAMTDALVREADLRGANLYITGQVRQPAHNAVEETGINVIGVGHRRCEEWGLRALAGVLAERWSRLEVVLPPRG